MWTEGCHFFMLITFDYECDLVFQSRTKNPQFSFYYAYDRQNKENTQTYII